MRFVNHHSTVDVVSVSIILGLRTVFEPEDAYTAITVSLTKNFSRKKTFFVNFFVLAAIFWSFRYFIV